MEPQAAAHIYTAITAVRAAIAQTGIAKSRQNTTQNYAFRGIDEMYNAVSVLLAQNNVCIMPYYSERTVVERESARGGALFYVSVRGAFNFVSAVDGSSHTVVTYGEAMDSADKATNKAMSAAMKYAIIETFTIPTKGDNDADATTHEVAKYTKAEQDILAGLNTAAAEGPVKLKAAWQATDPKVRDKLRAELESLKTTAAKNAPAPAPAPVEQPAPAPEKAAA
jgi:hypothetical protein